MNLQVIVVMALVDRSLAELNIARSMLSLALQLRPRLWGTFRVLLCFGGSYQIQTALVRPVLAHALRTSGSLEAQ